MLKNDRLDLLRNNECAYVVYWHHLLEHKDPKTQGYIGVAMVTKYAKRWSGDFKSNYVTSKIFYRAIQKYGEINIETTILKKCQSENESNQWEFYYRSKPLIGWNIRQGGGSSGKLSEATKQKISASKKVTPFPYNKIFTKETREKIRLSKIGNKNMQGKHFSKEVRQRMSDSAKRRGISFKTTKAKYKKVQCIETGQIFSSQVEAEQITGVPHKQISESCLTGHRAHGFHWRLI